MKTVISFLLATLLFSACTGNTIYKKPDNLIPKNKMIDLMVDLYIANAAYNIKNKNEEIQRNYVSLVYDQYGVDSLQYAQSNHYYMSKIDEYEKMHTIALEKIEALKQVKQKEFNKDKKVEQNM